MTNQENKTVIFNKLASEYDLWFEEQGKLVFDIEVSAFKEIMPLLPEPWLEIGVGSGRFAHALGIKKGIDPAEGLLKIAQNRGIEASLSSGEKCPFEECSFGTVFLIVTLCFVDSPDLVLKEAYRILAPKGKVVLGLVLKDSPWGKFYEQKKLAGHRFYKHAIFYKYKEITKLLAHSGFTLEKIVSTLFQAPQKVRDIELPREGYDPNAGFTVIVADREK